MQRVIERILNLLAFLLTAGRPVPADEIRNTVAGYDQPSDEAFHRMFERDKDLLRRLGIPLELAPTDGWQVEHGYLVDPDAYALPDPGLTDEERTALLLAAEVVRLGGQVSPAEAVFKLGGTPLTVSGEPLAASLDEGSTHLGTVFLALAEHRFVHFDYRGRARNVAPYGLVHRRGHWYLVGEEAGTVKVFRMDRVGSMEPGAEPNAFTRPTGFRAADAIPETPWEAGAEDIEAKVRFDAAIAWWARRQIGGRGSLVELPDGSIEAGVKVANPEAFLGWLLSFDDAAELLDPPELRAALLARVGEGR